jgi:hypothetical protein
MLHGWLVALPLVLLVAAHGASPAQARLIPAKGGTGGYRTGFDRWRAAEGGFAHWSRSGVSLNPDGSLSLDPASAQPGSDPYPPGGYNGRNYYNGGSFLAGEATSPETPADVAFTEAIAAWNAATPPGTWVETHIRARLGTRWTTWYNLGIWASDTSTIERHSVQGQGDSDGYVATDTLVITAKKAAATAYQLKVRLFSAADAVPSLRNASVAYSTTPLRPKSLAAGNPALWNRTLDVPACSQMVYPDGGEVWCSPTSTSMVLAYWRREVGSCEPRVRAAVAGVYDWVYDGHGNWPFNTAYAAAQGFEGSVARFTSMRQVEEWVAAGVPVVISYAWGTGDLDGAPIPRSAGHLAVLVGFDGAGNPVVNDPAAPDDASVRRTYDRAQLETLWLEHSGGTVYLIYPADAATPAL